jgi:hypothetical protein
MEMLEILQQTGCFNEERGITENGFSLKSTTEGQPPVIEFSLDPSIRPSVSTSHPFEDNHDWKELFETLQIIEHRAKTMGIDLWDLLQQEENNDEDEEIKMEAQWYNTNYTKVFTCPTLLDENHNLCRLLIQYGAEQIQTLIKSLKMKIHKMISMHVWLTGRLSLPCALQRKIMLL